MKSPLKWAFGILLLFGLSACEPSSTTEETTTDIVDSALVDGPTSDSTDTIPGIVRTDSTKSETGIRQYIEGNFTVPAAMEVIFGLYDLNIECSKWVCKPHEAKRFASKSAGKGLLHTRAAGTFPIETATGKKMLLLTETLSREKEGWEACHACAPILGAAMFQQIDGDWFIEALQKDLGEMGSWGQLPANKLVKIGPDMYGVLFNEGYTAQGITEAGISIVGMVDGEFQLLITENTSYSNEGMFADSKTEPKAFSYDSEISFQDKEPGKPYYLTILRKGRRPKDGRDGSGPVQDFSETMTYKIDKGKYVLVSN
jgi:hypothetical protein